MITGKFFIPQFDEHDDSVASIFRYNFLRYKSSIDRLGDTLSIHEKFPLYVTFSKELIEFNFQGKITAVNDNIHLVKSLHGQFPIMVIPVGDQIYTEKNRDITSIYCRDISLKIHEDYDLDSTHHLSSAKLDYSSLNIFNLEDTDWGSINWNKETNRQIESLFLRRLLLDFLDDFFNANVFHLSPLFSDVRAELLNSYIIKGIYLKSDFYAKSRMLASKDDRLAHYQYISSLEKWSAFMTRPEHKFLFRKGNGWFTYLDVETMSAMRGLSLYGQQDPTDENKLKVILKKSLMNLVREYELFKAATLIVSKTLKNSWLIGLVLIAGFLVYLVFSFQTADSYWKVFIILMLMIIFSNFFLLGLSVRNFFRSTVNLFLPRLMMAITTSWIAILSNVDYMKRTFIMPPTDAVKYASILCGITFIFLVQEIIRNTAITNPWKVFFKSSNIVFPGLIMSISIGLIGMFLLTKSHLVTSDFFDSKDIFRENIVEIKRFDDQQQAKRSRVEFLKIAALTTEDPGKLKEIRKTLQYEYLSLQNNIQDKRFTDHTLIFANLHKYHLVKPSKGKLSKGGGDKVAYYFFFKGLDNNPIILFPGFLILMSAFALFSGIFLTLLFDDKPVSEPL